MVSLWTTAWLMRGPTPIRLIATCFSSTQLAESLLEIDGPRCQEIIRVFVEISAAGRDIFCRVVADNECTRDLARRTDLRGGIFDRRLDVGMVNLAGQLHRLR